MNDEIKVNTPRVARKLTERIERINEINDFDLAWRWAGNDPEPIIEVYEEAEQHLLAAASPMYIHERLTEALPGWGLTEEAPDA